MLIWARTMAGVRRLACLALTFCIAGGAADKSVRVLCLADLHLPPPGAVAVAPAIAADPALRQRIVGIPGMAESMASTLQRLKREAAPSFAVVSGDLVTAFDFVGAGGNHIPGALDPLRRIEIHNPFPIYFALGNHDLTRYDMTRSQLSEIEDQADAGLARASWIRTLRSFRNGTWYGFEVRAGHTPYRVLVLDNAYAGERDAAGKREFGFSPDQLLWVKRQVRQHPEDVFVLVIHVPLGDDAMTRALVSSLASRSRPSVVVAGHLHDSDGIEAIPAPGQPLLLQVMIKAFFVSRENWRLLELEEDRIRISKTGRAAETARVLELAGTAAGGAAQVARHQVHGVSTRVQ